MAEINNAIALGVKPVEFNLGNSLLAAAQLRNADAQNRLANLAVDERGMRMNSLRQYQATGDVNSLAGAPDIMQSVVATRNAMDTNQRQQYDHRIKVMGDAARGLLPLVNSPDFPQQWSQTMDRLHNDKVIDANQHKQWRDNPSPLVLQQVLATSSTLDSYLKLEGQKAAGKIGEGLAGVLGGQDQSAPRGIRNNNPLNIEAGQFTQGLPGFSGSDGRFAKFASLDQGIQAADQLLQTYATKHGLNTVAGIVGRWAPANDGNNVNSYATNVAKQLGVDPNAPLDMGNPEMRQKLIGAMAQHENGRQLTPAETKSPLARATPFITRALAIPGIPDGLKGALTEFLKAGLEESKLTTDSKNYRDYVADQKARALPFKSRLEWEKELSESKRSQVNIDQRAEGELQKELGKGVAKMFNEMSEDGVKAADDVRVIGRLAGMLESSGTGSGVSFVNWVRSQTGIRLSEKADAAEAADSLINYMKPRMRVPGTGASSDKDLDAFGRSIPSLLSTPDGKRITVETLGGMAEARRLRGDVAMRVQIGEITPKGAIQEIRKLPDPFASFRTWQEAQGGRAGRAAPAMRVPDVGTIEDGHRFLGGNPAASKSWEKVQ